MTVEIAAKSAAAMNQSLLASKQIIRSNTPEMSERRREMLCTLIDDMFQLGFTAGVEYLGKEVLAASSISGGAKNG